jgi:hypothetical protein
MIVNIFEYFIVYYFLYQILCIDIKVTNYDLNIL